MSRRRMVAVVFGALIAVFVAGSAVTFAMVRGQLISSVDDELQLELDLQIQLYDGFETIEDFLELGNISIAASETMTMIVTPTGGMEMVIPAGSRTEPVPPPDLQASQVIASLGEFVTVDGTSGGPDYRLTVGQLEDGRFLAVGRPMDDVRSVLVALTRVLLFTLLGVIAVLGLIFWLALRASLRPYDDLVDTAEAIAAGDMDRRAMPSTSNPEITTLAASLNTMLDRLQESFDETAAAEARVKQFAADASHELRTPLTTISGYSELYLSGTATSADDVDKQMRRINGEAARMGRLVEQLLLLARFDHGEQFEHEPVDLGAIVRHVVEDTRVAHPELSIVGVIPPISTTVSGDPDALYQMIANLVTNARVHAAGSDVIVSLEVEGGEALLSVNDDGDGMPPEVAEHVFDRFYRADRSRQSPTASSGLGLAIVSAFAEAHGGSVSLSSTPGSGSRFTVRLPVLAGEQAPGPVIA